MSDGQATARVRRAVEQLFPEDRDEVVNILLNATGSERMHADILALSFGDRARLQYFARLAESDFRDVAMCEEFPEEFLDIANRPRAAAELARRFRSLGLDVPAATAYWARGYKPLSPGACTIPTED